MFVASSSEPPSFNAAGSNSPAPEVTCYDVLLELL